MNNVIKIELPADAFVEKLMQGIIPSTDTQFLLDLTESVRELLVQHPIKMISTDKCTTFTEVFASMYIDEFEKMMVHEGMRDELMEGIAKSILRTIRVQTEERQDNGVSLTIIPCVGWVPKKETTLVAMCLRLGYVEPGLLNNAPI